MSHLKNETSELLQYLRPHELAELEMLAMSPKDANGCVVMLTGGSDREAETKAGIQAYIKENGYHPPTPVICIAFD